ncbi:MAG: hypothetical protein GEU75_16100 [Dehalococcoidia bacterium]|nr:hypothetical protein [Dehalococcoidia bacterium]
MNNHSAIIVGVLGLLLAVPGFLLALNELGSVNLYRPFFGSPEAPAEVCGTSAPAEITLSENTAPRGHEVTVFGTCFRPAERVQIRVHVFEVGSATANSDGDFTQTIVIPESAPLNFPTMISATGRSSIKTGAAPFTATR